MLISLKPEDFPIKEEERWITLSKSAVLTYPDMGNARCNKDLLTFEEGKHYGIRKSHKKGWIVVYFDHEYEMPEYLFIRHFDYNAFLNGNCKNSHEEGLWYS